MLRFDDSEKYILILHLGKSGVKKVSGEQHIFINLFRLFFGIVHIYRHGVWIFVSRLSCISVYEQQFISNNF